MITPKFLENIETSKLIMIYSQLNIDITTSIIKRILEIGKIDSFTKNQIRVLVETNGREIFEEILNKNTELNSEVIKELRSTYEKMAQKNMEGYKELYKYKGIPFEISPAQLQILNGAIKQGGNDLINLTKTIAFSGQQLYVNAVDRAYFEVVTGGRDYISVIEDTVRNLAKEGVTLKDSAGRKVQLEVAVRRNVLTGVKNTADTITDEIEEELGCNGYEVVAHFGARPTHAEAQGKQYAKTKEDSKKYGVGYWGDVKDLWNEYNCRHTYFGIILGISEPVYTKKELKEMEKAKVTYKGEKITEYEATQIQRKLEREQRNLKRQIAPLKENDLDVIDLENRLKLRKKEYDNFCKETGLTKQNERTKVVF